jgi:hypothetical protein
MRFGQRYSIRENLTDEEFVRGIWSPTALEWRDVIEDYLYVSKKRIRNKLSMFKLQISIVQEIIHNVESVDSYKCLQAKLSEDVKSSALAKTDYDYQLKHSNSQIFSLKLINRALREIVDGIVWRYLDYNRAILFTLANKEPIEVIRADKGTFANLDEFAEVYSEHGSVAIYNDITNYLRIGDVTQFKDDGSIEIIEVKAGKQRGGRISRQKERMEELVEFVNTGNTIYDGKKLRIINSNVQQKTYMSQMTDAIKRAKTRG